MPKRKEEVQESGTCRIRLFSFQTSSKRHGLATSFGEGVNSGQLQCAICIDGNVRFDEDHTFAPTVLQVEDLALASTFPSSERPETHLEAM